jgi:hypothetical protein
MSDAGVRGGRGWVNGVDVLVLASGWRGKGVSK